MEGLLGMLAHLRWVFQVFIEFLLGTLVGLFFGYVGPIYVGFWSCCLGFHESGWKEGGSWEGGGGCASL